MLANSLILFGAGGENRTLMGSPPRDFESRASTNFTTPAMDAFIGRFAPVVNIKPRSGLSQ